MAISALLICSQIKLMDQNNLKLLLEKLRTKVRDSSGKIKEGELISMINMIAKAEMELRHNDNGNAEECVKEILKFVKEDEKLKT